VRPQVAAGADPKAALAAAARSSSGSLLVFGTNNGFFEDQKAAGDMCVTGPSSQAACLGSVSAAPTVQKRESLSIPDVINPEGWTQRCQHSV
jgi:hypothetical protein